MISDPIEKFVLWMGRVISAYPMYAGDLIIVLVLALILVSFGRWPTFRSKKRQVVTHRHRSGWSRPPVT